MPKRPFRADHVGSLIRPDRLIEARAKREKGEIDQKSFKSMEDGCVIEAVKIQEEAGLQAITDGEMRRGSWSRDFLLGFDNTEVSEGRLDIYFKNADGTLTSTKPNGIRVTGKLKRSKPIQVADFQFLKDSTKRVPKVCVPSPTLMHFRGGREDVDKVAYPQMKDFFADLAKAYNDEIDDLVGSGATYLQIDDTNLAYLCDTRFRDAVKQIGEDPDKLPEFYVSLINECVKTVPEDVTLAIHLCRGNASTGGLAAGSYEPVAEAILSGLHVDGFFLEYDDERSGDFTPLRFLAKGKTVVLGLVTTKRAELESKDELKRRIDQAAKIVPLEQLALSPQCGFSSGASGNPSRRHAVTIGDERAKLARIVETAREVWGEL
jgi:methionine synthase II (cobalamin-independent)